MRILDAMDRANYPGVPGELNIRSVRILNRDSSD